MEIFVFWQCYSLYPKSGEIWDDIVKRWVLGGEYNFLDSISLTSSASFKPWEFVFMVIRLQQPSKWCVAAAKHREKLMSFVV